MSTCQSPTGGSRTSSNKGLELKQVQLFDFFFFFLLLSLIKKHYNINLDRKPRLIKVNMTGKWCPKLH